MCGIAGVFSKEPVSSQVVETMLAQIAYRGPDGSCVNAFQGPGSFLTVGQVRLAIIDPRPEANQPFEVGSDVLIFNGEFYNFQEIKERVFTNQQLITRSDTEIALRWLSQTFDLNELWGMFAGSFYSTHNGILRLFVDRFGKKPLYVYPHQNRIYFASEPKSILAVLDHKPELNSEAILAYQYLGYIPLDLCIYKGMQRIQAGELWTIKSDFEIKKEFWYQPQTEASMTEFDFESTFLDAIRIRMISDRPLGAFLSGGIDSSLVVAGMTRFKEKPNTFSVRFEGKQALDESPFARLVAKHCGTNHHEIVLNPQNLQDLIPEVLDHFDEPFGDSSAIPTYLISQEAVKHFTVALTGDGADEVFGGYRKYLGPYYLDKLGPGWWRRGVLKPLTKMLPSGRTHKLLETSRKVRRLLQADHPNPSRRHLNWMHQGPFDWPYLVGQIHHQQALNLIDEWANCLPQKPSLTDYLMFDQKMVLAGDMLVKVDRMSMKASLELRSPFLDHRIVEFANQLPDERKVWKTERKKFLKDKLGHWIPEQIFNRPKSGFEMPLGHWMRNQLAPWVEKTLFEGQTLQPYCDIEKLKNAWHKHRNGQLDATEPIWYHVVLAHFLNRYHQ